MDIPAISSSTFIFCNTSSIETDIFGLSTSGSTISSSTRRPLHGIFANSRNS
jgi:hypothetical protein